MPCKRRSAGRRPRVAEVELPDTHELEERRDKAFSRRVALITAIYAVVLAIAFLGGSNVMKHMLLAQQQSSDQWAFYQAKVIREHLYRSQRLAVELALAGPVPAAARAKYEDLAKRVGDEERRFSTEKRDIEQAATRLEHERDLYRARDPYFEGAEVFLQIAIVTASVSILATSRPMFGFSLVLAAIGALSCANGFMLFTRVPWLHGH